MTTMIAGVLMVTVAATANAYTVKGSVECPDIMREDRDEHYREYNKWWLLGYITARNYDDDAQVGAGVEDDDIYRMALSYCSKNSADDWDDAAIYIYNRLKN